MLDTFKDAQNDRSFVTLHTKLQNFAPETIEFLKTANINVDYDELSELPDNAFAYPEFRKLAMHTKEHTALSLIYANEEELPQVVTDRLEKAAALFEVALETKGHDKVASDETSFDASDYLLPEQGMCKVASAADINSGIHFLKINKSHLDVMATAHANGVLYKKAQEFDVKLPTHVMQEAGLTMCKVATMIEWIEARQHATGNVLCKEAYQEVAEAARDTESLDRSSLLKVASTIATIDIEADVTKHYNKSLLTPMQTVFNMDKVAEVSMDLAGESFDMSQLMAIPAETYSDILGEDVLPEITTDGELDDSKLQDVLLSLPADFQNLLVQHISQGQ